MHFHMTILWFQSPCHLIMCLNLCRRLFFTQIVLASVKLRDRDAKFSQVIGNLCPPPLLLLPILSTPLDFNHRYSRGSANECSSPRVHPKVTHLKRRTTRGKHFTMIMCILTPLLCHELNVILYEITLSQCRMVIRLFHLCLLVCFRTSSCDAKLK